MKYIVTGLPVLVFAAVAAAQFQNPGFETGLLGPWDIAATTNGRTTVQTVEVHDFDGPGPFVPSRAAKFDVGQVAFTPNQEAGIELTQLLTLQAGFVELSCTVGVFRPVGGGNNQGGRFALIIGGREVAAHNFGVINGQQHYSHRLSVLYDVLNSGNYRVGVRITRHFLPSTEPIFQYVDNFMPSFVQPPDECDVLDFQSLERRGNALLNDIGDVYQEDGYLFTKPTVAPGLGQFAIFGTAEPRYPGSTALFNNTINSVTTLRRTDGRLFNITYIDLANLNAGGPAPVTFTGFLQGGGTVVRAVNTGDPPGLPNRYFRIDFPGFFNGLHRLEWTQVSPFHQFDNIKVSTTTKIDFEGLRQDNGVGNPVASPYEEDGYRLTKIGGSLDFATFGTQDARFPGSTALWNRNPDGITRLERTDGGPFDLFEMKLANLSGAGPAPISITGTRIDGSTVPLLNFNTGDPNGLPNTLARNFLPTSARLLRKVEWVQTSPFHQFDDIVVGCSNLCYACDCDLSSGIAVCDIFDFLCYQGKFAANDPYACDCDTSSGPGACDIFDFLCFQGRFEENCGRNQ